MGSPVMLCERWTRRRRAASDATGRWAAGHQCVLPHRVRMGGGALCRVQHHPVDARAPPAATAGGANAYGGFVTGEGASDAAAGIVYLVGAGPGDPGLITARGRDLIASCDAIVHDALANPALYADTSAALHDVGKRGGSTDSARQGEINALLVRLAREGQRVVRLKGGDPFVFGRGSEEAQALAAAGIPFEVVPAVTAGIAAPAYAGIPVTHRDEASAVAFVTGHEHPAKPESAIDWDALARFPGTLVFYMGVKQLPEITRRLIEAGRAGDMAAAVVERGTLPGQRAVVATLADIAATVADAGVRPPAITLVGPVAKLAGEIAWLDRRPLGGRTVAVTRARAQASGLARRLTRLGAEVVETPAIRIEPRPVTDEVAQAAREIATFALVCVTSPNGAALLLDAVESVGGDARSLAGVEVAAIGPGTAAELARRGIRADTVAEVSTAEGLLDAIADLDLAGERVLVA